MSILIRAVIPGMTVQQYDGMSTTQLEQQKGFIAHAGIPIPGGFEIVEMWESQEAVDAWLKSIIKPASAEAGVVAPILQFYPAQRIVTR